MEQYQGLIQLTNLGLEQIPGWMGANVSQNGWLQGESYYCWGGLLSNKAQSYFPAQTVAINSQRHTGSGEREVCFIAPRSPFACAVPHTFLPPVSPATSL